MYKDDNGGVTSRNYEGITDEGVSEARGYFISNFFFKLR